MSCKNVDPVLFVPLFNVQHNRIVSIHYLIGDIKNRARILRYRDSLLTRFRSEMFDHRQHNRQAWDRLVRDGNRFAQPAKDSDFADPLKTVDGPGWLGASIAGQRVLCLAAGGGRHGPIYAAADAIVTVVDLSPEMLELDRAVARQRGFTLRTIETSMEDLSMFHDSSFDIVIHPVSTCYVPNVRGVFDEIARVIRVGGVYVSQHKQPASLQASCEPSPDGYVFEHPIGMPGPLPRVTKSNLVREQGTAEYVHGWQDLLGGMCRAGFAIQDIIEPAHADPAAGAGSFGHRSCYVAPYIRIKAVRNEQPVVNRSKIIYPE